MSMKLMKGFGSNMKSRTMRKAVIGVIDEVIVEGVEWLTRAAGAR
jgi:hypothetical protein